MSFVITVNVPSAIIMASDSRQSITIEGVSPNGKPTPKIETVNSDSANKLFLLEDQEVGIGHYGEDLLGKVAIETHIKRFSEQSVSKSDNVTTVPSKLLEFIRKDFPKADTAFQIAGFKKSNGKTEPYVWLCHVAKDEVERQNGPPKQKNIVYGATWGGQIDIISSLLNPAPGRPKAPVIWDAMTVQDAIDFAIYAVRTTIDTMRFQARPKNVGGPIDVLLLLPDEKPTWIQKKKFTGEKTSLI